MPLVYTAFTFIVYWKLWTPIDGASGSWRYDPRFEYWGDLIFQFETLADGQLALWNPYDRGGFPLYGDPQPGMLYPPNWLLYLWGAMSGAVPFAAIGAKILLHWIFGAVGMHLLLRRLGAGEPGAYLGGLLFSWSCPKVRYGGSALNWSIAWIPWLLLAIAWLAEKPSWRRGVVVGTTAAMILLSGAPAVLVYAMVIVIPCGLYMLRGKWRVAWRPVAIAAVTALCWLAVLLASNAEQLPESVRETRDLAFITDSVFFPGTFVNFLAPRMPEGENIYYGLFSILCVGVLVGSRGRGLALILLCVAAIGAALALGHHAGFMGATASAAPIFGLFRRAHRYLYITSIAISILAGLGLGRLLSLSAGDEDRKRALARQFVWIGGTVTFALGIAYLVSLVVHDKATAPKTTALAFGFAGAALGTWLLRAIAVNHGRRQIVYAWLAVVLCAADFWTAQARIISSGFVPHPDPRRDGILAQLDDVTRTWRVYDHGYLDFRAGTRLQIRDFGGYEIDPLGLSRYTKFLHRGKRHLPLLGHANVRYVLQGDRKPVIRPRASDRLTTLQKGVYELPDVAPAVMYVPRPEPVAGVDQALARLAKLTPGQGAVVEGPAVPAGPAGAPITTGVLVTLEPNRVVAEIDTPGPGLVVIAEAYFPAWTATVNGVPTGIQPANAMFRGIPVTGAGHHRIELRLVPMRFWGLLPLYIAAWLALIAAIFWPWIASRLGRAAGRRRAPRSPRTDTPPMSDPTTESESA